MAWSSRITRLFASPWRRLISVWVEPRLIEPEPQELALCPTLPTLYVLPHPAFSDAVLLAELCARHGLPSPDEPLVLAGTAQRALLALPHGGRRLWPGAAPRAPFMPLIEFLSAHPEADLQLVPVSIFWGRAPGKRFGLWKMLAADSWQFTGRLRRALSVLVNGKSVEMHFGAPLRLKELLDERPQELTNRKTARLLRIHFRRMRTRVLGPDLSHRRTLVDGVVASPAVRQVIAEVASAQRRAPRRVERRARRYGLEIASNMSYPVLRFMDQLLRRLWNRLYDGVDVRGLARVKPLAGDHTLVYVPCHRSHIDYLLLSYVLYREGLMPPHVAAGRNLDMPVIGGLLRRGGAFFLRRSFKDNRLYGAVFNEYLHRLLSRGHPLEYFIEGGRSRSGRMLTPRPGMLAMTLRSYLRNPGQKIAFVPVYIGYERILESGSYQKEMHGQKKRKESPLDLLRIRHKLRQPFGRVAVNIGEPLALDAFLDAQVPEWRHQGGPRPRWMTHAVPRLGDTLAQRINAAASLNAVNLVGLVMLATPYHAIESELLTRQLSLLVALHGKSHAGRKISLPEGSPATWIDQTVVLGMVTRRDQALGELVVASPEQAALLSWYRNNVLHLFALPALVAFAFRNNSRFTLTALLKRLAPSWSILARELYIAPPDDLAKAIADTLEQLKAQGLLELHDDTWHKPANQLGANEQLRLLSQLVQPSLERGYLLLASLLRQPSGTLDRAALAEQARLLAERLSLLSGLDAPEYFDARLFSGLVESLEAERWLWQVEEKLCFGEALLDASQQAQGLFDPALRQRLYRITTTR
ncbi:MULTISPECIES: glycerol-3-phosphate 1-O-acyltransferase PlsB [Halomonadaceae]|uniref:glycerol-3-phosphate 1-O-acyltransferase PlsB n=1 Tax=Halomonadaceae TaxID=28256 RepID=UPI001599EC65|nr:MULTISPECIES: glycerol-3-phosphate 1-O-acyltransferase PlsB [Halomonas]QJQ96784.1 glycerol-3-phosphate 1-O-acyltransferase PlsB [Halomonas sp. PA5]